MKVTKETTILESVKNYKAVNEDLKAETDGEDIKVKATDDPGNVEAIALVDRRRNFVKKNIKDSKTVENGQEVADQTGKGKKVLPLRLCLEESKIANDRTELTAFIKEAREAGKKYLIKKQFNEDKSAKVWKFTPLRESVTDDFINLYTRMHVKLEVLLNAMREIVDLYEEDEFAYDTLNNTPGYPEGWKSLDEECVKVENWLEEIEEALKQQTELKKLDDKDESLKEACYKVFGTLEGDDELKGFCDKNGLKCSQEDKMIVFCGDENKLKDLHKEFFSDYELKIEEGCKIDEAPVYELSPKSDSRKSFYGKATVDVSDDGKTQTLISYNTPVCRIETLDNGEKKVTLLRKGYLSWASSQTTLRHVKEFLKQNGCEAGSVKELAAKYPEEEA